MAENENLNGIWDSLSGPEKQAVLFLGTADWRTGDNEAFLDELNVDTETVKSLIDRKIVETKPTWQMFQDSADQIKDRANQIQEKATNATYNEITDEERQILSDYSLFSSVAAKKNEEPRYRIADRSFQGYVENLLTKK